MKANKFAPLLREMDSELVKNVAWDVSFNNLKIKKWVHESKIHLIVITLSYKNGKKIKKKDK